MTLVGPGAIGYTVLEMTDRVKSLEQDVAKLDETEFRRFAKWFASYQDRIWQKQIVLDSKSGKLDFLLDEANTAKRAGKLEEF